MSDREWMVRASCSGEDPEMFFDPHRVREAVSVCCTCPVVKACADYRRKTQSPFGVWAGKPQATNPRTLGPTSLKQDIRHGTPGGYRTHQRRGQMPCERCRIANTFDREERRARKQANA